MKKSVFLLAIGFGLIPTSVRAQSVQVSYLANNGALYDDGAIRIVVDGLFRAHYPQFPPLPDSLRIPFERAEDPFTDIDVLLVTHNHRDHFHPEAVSAYLCANPSAQLISTPQVVEEIEQVALCDIDPTRVSGAVDSRVIEDGGSLVRIHPLPLPHANPDMFADVENTGFFIEFGSIRILHLGDSGISGIRWNGSIDLLTMPAWNMSDPEFEEEYIRSGEPQIALVHITPSMTRALLDQAEQTTFKPWIPVNPFEQIEVVK